MPEREIIERLDRIESLLTGNNTPERGVIVRLDRVERDIERVAITLKEDRDARNWFARTILGAALTAAAAAVAAWLKR